jgi:hypothetical protein
MGVSPAQIIIMIIIQDLFALTSADPPLQVHGRTLHTRAELVGIGCVQPFHFQLSQSEQDADGALPVWTARHGFSNWSDQFCRIPRASTRATMALTAHEEEWQRARHELYEKLTRSSQEEINRDAIRHTRYDTLLTVFVDHGMSELSPLTN